MSRLWVKVRIVVAILYICTIYIDAMDYPEMEDHLETEIDARLPSSFATSEILSSRGLGFKKMVTNKPTGSETWEIANWEIWVKQYWYETRIQNTSCPQTPFGIAARADWALTIPCLYGDPYMEGGPKIVHVNTYMLPHFAESTLHFMDKSARFILLSSGSDLTVPRSTDPRFQALRGFGGGGGNNFWKIYNDPRVIHWYAENNDLTLPKFSTLPTGLTWVQGPDDFTDHPPRDSILPIKERPLKVLVADRVRGGSPQWNLRFEVVTMCDWESSASWCMRPEHTEGFEMDKGLSHKDFLAMVVSVPFIACPHGGGIDPSPKAWEALLVGAIPIVERSTLNNAYEKFPIMFVDSLKTDLFEQDPANATKLLKEWREKLAPYYEEGSELRRQTLDRLRTDYWISEFRNKIDEYEKEQESVQDGWDSILNVSSSSLQTRRRRSRTRRKLRSIVGHNKNGSR